MAKSSDNTALFRFLRRTPSKDPDFYCLMDEYKALKKRLVEQENLSPEAAYDRAVAEFVPLFNDAHVEANRRKQLLRTHTAGEGDQKFDLVGDVIWVYLNRNVDRPPPPPSTGALGLLEHATKEPGSFYKDFIAPLTKSIAMTDLAKTIGGQDKKVAELAQSLHDVLDNDNGTADL